jgi:signal transduction histidine kinase
VPRWARVPILFWSAGLLYLLFPTGLYAALEPPSEWAFPMFVGGLCAGAIAQIYRYVRVSQPVQRQQTKWVVFGATAAVAGTTMASALPALFPSLTQPGLPALLTHLASDTAITFCLLLIPVSIGIAVLRYRLWDIDPIVNRTLVYGGLTTGVVGIYVLVVGGLGAVFQTGGNLLISLLATGIVAVLFQPLRDHLQRAVNRLMYGERDEPYTVISRLGQRLEATLAPDAVLPTVVETVKEALKLPYAAIALKQDDTLAIAAEDGRLQHSSLPNDLVRLPLVYQNEPVGELLLAPRATGESFSSADHRLLDDLARQAGVAAHAVQLTMDLQRSRERLVTAREEERRRLRRDLHDGLGPQLASLTLKLDAARNLLGHNPAATDALLAELKGQTQGAISDIRRLVYALRPPALDDLGLVSALREQAAQYQHTGVHITVQAPERMPSLPAAVEVAAYRIAQEALINVVRHADARNCTIRLALDNGLCVEVTDDGHGIEAEHHAGVGLHSMRERAEELGGNLAIESMPTRGTRVQARLPLSS